MKQKKISLENLATFAGQLKARYAEKDDIPAKVSDLDNDAGYQTAAQVTDSINAKISSAYTAGGSAAFETLPELKEENVGLVVNLTEDFTTTDSFAAGAGSQYPAGTNVVVVKSGDEYKYDVLSSFVDLSGYASDEELAEAKADAVAQANAHTDWKLDGYVKAEDMEEVTEEEILALFAEE